MNKNVLPIELSVTKNATIAVVCVSVTVIAVSLFSLIKSFIKK